MALQDIMPASSPHGGWPRVAEWRLKASETFVIGEPVSVNSSGFLTESADDPDDDDLMGIAASGGDTTASTGTLDPDTGSIITTSGMVRVYLPDPTTYFKTINFTSAGSAFGDAAPAVTHIGDECGLTVISGSWGLDLSATHNLCRIVDVLDSNGASIMRSGGTGVTVIFQIIAHQSNTIGAADAPIA